MNASILTASHFGTVHFGDLDCDAVVHNSGERGYVRKQVAKALGVHENNTGHRFRQILADYAPNALSELEKFESPISLPSGRRAQFFPAGVAAFQMLLHQRGAGGACDVLRIERQQVADDFTIQFHRFPLLFGPFHPNNAQKGKTLQEPCKKALPFGRAGIAQAMTERASLFII